MDASDLDIQRRLPRVVKGLGVNLSSVEEEPTLVVEDKGDDEEPKEAEARVATTSAINLFQHPNAHPLVLDVVLLQKYGPEWMIWEPDILELKILHDFKTASVSDLNMDKLQAVKTMHFVDNFWKKWEVFLWCTMPLNNVYPDFMIMQVPSVEQCLVSVDMANRIRDDVQWSDEIKAYLEVVFRHDGIFCALDPINFVEIDTPELLDCATIQERWKTVRAKGRAPTGQTAEDEQLRRMLEAHEHLEEHRDLLRQQIHLVSHV